MLRRDRLLTLLGCALVTLGLGWASGCSLLVPFDPVDAGGDANTIDDDPPDDDRDVRSRPPDPPDEDVRVPDPPDTGPVDPKAPPECDRTADLGAINCGAVNRDSCASRLPGYTGPAGDLVDCSSGMAKCVRHCPQGCFLWEGQSFDVCDDCFGRPNGTYCGKDMRGQSERFAVHCENGKTIGASPCGVDRCATDCPRGGVHQPSCCI